MTTVSIRRPVPQDRDRIIQMRGRCSTKSRVHRFHSPVATFPSSYLETVISDPDASRVAEQQSGELVGLASLVVTDLDRADLGVLVEDRRQRQGIGTILVRALLADAHRRLIRTLKADILRSNQAGLSLLRRIPGECQVTAYGPTIEATVQLALPPSAVDTEDDSPDAGSRDRRTQQGTGSYGYRFIWRPGRVDPSNHVRPGQPVKKSLVRIRLLHRT